MSPLVVDELEVKARVTDPPRLRRALERAGATREFSGAMLDRRLDREGRLIARDEVLRLRIYRPADGSAAYGMLGWKGPHSARGAYRHRAEVEARIADLRRKANEGTLTPTEEAEYKDFIGAVDLISIMQAKARRFLAKQSV